MISADCYQISHHSDASEFLPVPSYYIQVTKIRRNDGVCLLVGYFTLPLYGNIMLLGKTNVLI